MSYPLTAGVGLAAVGMTVLVMMGYDLQWLIGSGGPVWREPWVLITSILPHAGLMHLVFNLYWWWYFGTRLEATWGWLRLAGVTVLLALISSSAEAATGATGIGLSGVGYGLFAMLYVVQKRDERFAGIVSQRTAVVFVVWFFLCIALTAAKAMNVGNVAHGAGAVAGALIGWAVISRGGARIGWSAVTAVALVVGVWGATLGRARVMGAMTQEPATLGYLALLEKDYAKATPLLEQAVAKNSGDDRSIANLGQAYQGLRRFDDAARMYERAVKLKPEKREKLAPTLAGIRRWQAEKALAGHDYKAADNFAISALEWDSRDTKSLRVRGWAAINRDDGAKAAEYFAAAAQNAQDQEYPLAVQTFDRASAQCTQRKFDGAIEDFKKAIAMDPSLRPNAAQHMAAMLGTKAQEAFFAKDAEKATALADEALSWSDQCAMAYWTRGWVNIHRGKTEQALAALAIAREQFPEANYPTEAYLYDMAAAEFAGGNLDEALKRFEVAAETSPAARARVSNQVVDILLRKGTSAVHKGENDECLAIAERVLTWDSANGSAWWLRGSAYSNLKREKEARAAFAQARQLLADLDYSWSAYLYDLGRVTMAAKRYEESAAIFEQILRLQPYMLEVRFYQGECFEAMNRFDEAAACYRRALGVPMFDAKAREGLARLGSK